MPKTYLKELGTDIAYQLLADKRRRKEISDLQSKYGDAWERHDQKYIRCRAEWWDFLGGDIKEE